MELRERQRALDGTLLAFHGLWHPQPFRESRPGWCDTLPALAAEVLGLPDDAVARLNDDGVAALKLLSRHLPEAGAIGPLAALPERPMRPLPDLGPHWAWEIPGRKRSQIESFARTVKTSGRPLLDWCGGKGHLGRLLALHWQVSATSLDLDPALCAEGEELARRAGISHDFLVGDALMAGDDIMPGRHLVALHACGDLHRRAVRMAGERGVVALDVAPCCYYRGVQELYQPLSAGLGLALTRDDTRLAVTETVTAAPRQARRRDRDMAWKLGFDVYRREVTGIDDYRTFKPVPPAWFAGDFEDFLRRMAAREGLPSPGRPAEFESLGWERQREVMRLSVVRNAFRRPLELWLALDLAVHLEQEGYDVDLGVFCPRELTPRNLLLSARR